jgi:hypothetical protein
MPLYELASIGQYNADLPGHAWGGKHLLFQSEVRTAMPHRQARAIQECITWHTNKLTCVIQLHIYMAAFKQASMCKSATHASLSSAIMSCCTVHLHSHSRILFGNRKAYVNPLQTYMAVADTQACLPPFAHLRHSCCIAMHPYPTPHIHDHARIVNDCRNMH